MENELNFSQSINADIPQNAEQNTEQINADTAREKPKVPLFEGIFAWVIFALGFVFTHFAFNYAGGIWGGIFWFLFGASGAVFVKVKKITITKPQIFVFIIAEIFSLSPFFCADRFINFLSAMFVFVLFFYLLTAISGAELFGRHFVINLLESVFVRPFISFTCQPVCMFSVFNGKKRAKNIAFALIGILCAVPLTVIVARLLMSSDDIFEGVLRKVIENLPDISFAIIPEILFAFPIAMYLFGAVFSAGKPAPAQRMGEPDYRRLPPIVGYVAVSPICVFYMFYIGIQISRIFGETLSTPANYSGFARRGFFELCVITVINLVVIIIMQMFTRRLEGDKKPVALRAYTVLLCVSTLGIIATALVKMIMYINRLGMTVLRVYTSWFMILLAIIFVIITFVQFKDFGFWKAIFAAFAVMFGILCFGDIDGQIARYNISAYQSGAISEIDIDETFYQLGFSAVEPAVKLKQSGYSSPELDDFLQQMKADDDFYDKFAYFSIPRAIGQSAL